METKTFTKKVIGSVIALTTLPGQSMVAQQNIIIEDTSSTHSIIFIASILFFIIGFALLIVLKLRDDAKSKKNTHITAFHKKNKHHHPNHYGHRHQYHH